MSLMTRFSFDICLIFCIQFSRDNEHLTRFLTSLVRVFTLTLSEVSYELSVEVFPCFCALRSLTPSITLLLRERSGSHLASHAVSNVVLSAVPGLTVVFGMGTGVTPERIATGNIRCPWHLNSNTTPYLPHVSIGCFVRSSLERR